MIDNAKQLNDHEWLETSQGFIRLDAVTVIQFNPSLMWEQEIRISCGGHDHFKYLVGQEANMFLEKMGIERRVPLESKPVRIENIMKIESIIEPELHQSHECAVKKSLLTRMKEIWKKF